MKFALAGGVLWGLDTTILSIALSLSPYFGTVEALAFASVVSAAFHDVFCAVWLFIYMGARGRLKQTLSGLRTRSGIVIALGALLGGPLGMTGYLIAISHIGAGYTAIISAFYPAFGALMAYLILKEHMQVRQFIALFVALGGVMYMGYAAAGSVTFDNPLLGIAGALLCVVGWGSEAVLVAWGMRDESVDNEVALQIRETTSMLVYVLIVLPLFGALNFASSVALTPATGVVGLAALAGVCSYLFYYKGIAHIGAARGMALNISYSVWAVVFGVVLLGVIPSVSDVVCCFVILGGTLLAACDWDELFGSKQGTSQMKSEDH